MQNLLECIYLKISKIKALVPTLILILGANQPTRITSPFKYSRKYEKNEVNHDIFKVKITFQRYITRLIEFYLLITCCNRECVMKNTPKKLVAFQHKNYGLQMNYNSMRGSLGSYPEKSHLFTKKSRYPNRRTSRNERTTNLPNRKRGRMTDTPWTKLTKSINGNVSINKKESKSGSFSSFDRPLREKQQKDVENYFRSSSFSMNKAGSRFGKFDIKNYHENVINIDQLKPIPVQAKNSSDSFKMAQHKRNRTNIQNNLGLVVREPRGGSKNIDVILPKQSHIVSQDPKNLGKYNISASSKRKSGSLPKNSNQLYKNNLLKEIVDISILNSYEVNKKLLGAHISSENISHSPVNQNGYKNRKMLKVPKMEDIYGPDQSPRIKFTFKLNQDFQSLNEFYFTPADNSSSKLGGKNSKCMYPKPIGEVERISRIYKGKRLAKKSLKRFPIKNNLSYETDSAPKFMKSSNVMWRPLIGDSEAIQLPDNFEHNFVQLDQPKVRARLCNILEEIEDQEDSGSELQH
ncbi:unnamed protein product [Moneuplotes crassus]|uniref:Uncharacterized protein n=1 Tax=Euplotes crassus TaxID=5936 RepID=A0AAD1U3E0_EUPCR|nr:unnamed protein product [Moneuplotes crassus]